MITIIIIIMIMMITTMILIIIIIIYNSSHHTGAFDWEPREPNETIRSQKCDWLGRISGVYINMISKHLHTRTAKEM